MAPQSINTKQTLVAKAQGIAHVTAANTYTGTGLQVADKELEDMFIKYKADAEYRIFELERYNKALKAKNDNAEARITKVTAGLKASEEGRLVLARNAGASLGEYQRLEAQNRKLQAEYNAVKASRDKLLRAHCFQSQGGQMPTMTATSAPANPSGASGGPTQHSTRPIIQRPPLGLRNQTATAPTATPTVQENKSAGGEVNDNGDSSGLSEAPSDISNTQQPACKNPRRVAASQGSLWTADEDNRLLSLVPKNEIPSTFWVQHRNAKTFGNRTEHAIRKHYKELLKRQQQAKDALAKMKLKAEFDKRAQVEKENKQ